MIERATDATFINQVVNHPAVRPSLSGKPGDRVDLTEIVANPDHLVLQGEFGGMILVQQVDAIWELHTAVLPEGRGEWALEMARSCVDYLFCKTNAVELFTRVPAGNLAAAALTKACGAMFEHRTWQDLGAGSGWVEIWGGRVQDWARIAPHLAERGKEFHRRLEQKYAALGIKTPVHPEDPWHDRHVGAAAGMILGGQVIKGVLMFNRWAAMAFAPPIKLLSMEPVVLNITDCLVQINGDDFEVLRCQ